MMIRFRGTHDGVYKIATERLPGFPVCQHFVTQHKSHTHLLPTSHTFTHHGSVFQTASRRPGVIINLLQSAKI
jgi:hypothetical protein